ncbi:MAG: hypothetical protein IT200_16390 [Thermoleophilia bacterium]|nr:hypothetical protein [Thermoleophilia bacterium]
MLPAPVVLATANRTACGRIVVSRSGTRRGAWRPSAPSLPPGSVMFAARDLVVTSNDGHMVIRRGGRPIWTSTGRFRLLGVDATPLSGVAAASGHVAFSTFTAADRRSHALWVATNGGSERIVADSAEIPLGFTATGALFTVPDRPGVGTLIRRDAPYDVAIPIADGVRSPVWNPVAGAVQYLDRGLWTTTAAGGVRRLQRLGRIGLTADERRYVLQPIERGLLTVRGGRRFAVLGADGRLLRSVRLGFTVAFGDFGGGPRLAPDGTAVAVPIAWMHAVRGGVGPDGRIAVLVIDFAGGPRILAPTQVPPRRLKATLAGWSVAVAWHGRWVLLSSSDGTTMAVDSRNATAVDLTPAALAAVPGGQPAARHRLVARWGHSSRR